MLFNKNNLFFLVILVVVIVGLIIRVYSPYPKNQFGILGNESFSLTHLYNVNGIVGAEKTEFNKGEIREIMDLLSNLDYKEPLLTPNEKLYGVPVQLKISKPNGSKIVFSFNTDIGVIEYDKNENILSKKIYTSGKKQRNNIYKILEITQD